MNNEKKLKLGYVKKIDSKKKTIDAYVSTFEWDRMDERFVRGAWDLDQFKRNPVVLWSHDMSTPPIGRNIEMIEDEKGLLARTEFDSEGELSSQVFSLFERGFLNAFSVGFIRKNYVVEQMNENRKGLAITDAELYEYSAVSVPANPGAIVSREVAELAIKTLGNDAIKSLKSDKEEYFMVPEQGKTDDLSGVLKRIVELAKTIKGTDLNESKRSLILTTMDVFKELIGDSQEQLNIKELTTLQNGLKEFASVLSIVHPEVAPNIIKLISQVDKALIGKA